MPSAMDDSGQEGCTVAGDGPTTFLHHTADYSYSPDYDRGDQRGRLMSGDTCLSVRLDPYHQHHLYQQPNCAACGAPIADRYLLKVCDSVWHEHCLSCSVCDARLAQSPSCYVRDGKIFCKVDYKRIFGAKCGRCLNPLNSSDVVQRTMDFVYHAACFTCICCGHLLRPGDQFVVNDGQLVCRPDYESIIMTGPFGQGFGVSGRLSDHRKAPKRPRTILTSQQRKAFKASFEISAKPCRKVRESLAKETGLSVRVVQVWFQNQRAKMKKLQRKQEQSQKRSPCSSGADGDKEGTSMDKDGDSFPCKRPKHAGDATPASSSIDSSSDELEASSSPSLSDVPRKAIADDADPIHKLYSMQESYFSF